MQLTASASQPYYTYTYITRSLITYVHTNTYFVIQTALHSVVALPECPRNGNCTPQNTPVALSASESSGEGISKLGRRNPPIQLATNFRAGSMFGASILAETSALSSSRIVSSAPSIVLSLFLSTPSIFPFLFIPRRSFRFFNIVLYFQPHPQLSSLWFIHISPCTHRIQLPSYHLHPSLFYLSLQFR